MERIYIVSVILVLTFFSINCRMFSKKKNCIKCWSFESCVILEQSCMTPDRYGGQCVDIRRCKNLYGILQNAPRPLPERVRDYLQRAKCVNNANPVSFLWNVISEGHLLMLSSRWSCLLMLIWFDSD